MPTIADFCAALRRETLNDYEWARKDPVQLDRFISRMEGFLRDKRMGFIHDGPAMVKAWRAIGFKGRPTWKVLFTLT